MIVPDWAGYLQFRSAFAEVIDDRYHTLGWLDRQVLDGKVQFWRGEHAGLLTEIKHYPTGAKDIHVVIAAGDMVEIMESLAPQAEEYGRSQGCLGATVESRMGWARALKPYGYEMHQVTVRKELRHGA